MKEAKTGKERMCLASERNEAITAHGLSVGYATPILKDINITLPYGEVTALVGRNGAGKSTLLKTLSGVIPPLSGEVLIEGRSIRSMKPSTLAHRMSLVTTERGMAAGLTLRQLVALGRQPHTGLFGILSASDRECVERCMKMLKISHLAEKHCATLSDGEFQKGLIARALAQDTPIMLLDEPLSHLDVAARVEIMAMLQEIAAASRKAILLSTHDVAQALRMAGRIWMVASDGAFIDSTPANLMESENIRRLFDVENVIFDPLTQDFIHSSKIQS